MKQPSIDEEGILLYQPPLFAEVFSNSPSDTDKCMKILKNYYASYGQGWSTAAEQLARQFLKNVNAAAALKMSTGKSETL